jgi:hypothetical protein
MTWAAGHDHASRRREPTQEVVVPHTEIAAIGASAPAPEWQRWRVILIRIWAGLLSVQTLLMAQGLVMIGQAGPGQHFMYATSTVWKLLSLGGVFVLLWTGGRSVISYWAIGVGQVVWVSAGVLVPQPDGNPLLVNLANLLIFYGPLVALRPQRRQLLHPHFRANRGSLAIAAAGFVPLVLFAMDLAGRLRGELGFDMVGLYLALGATALFAALQPFARRWLTQAVALSAALVGVAALVYPQDQASAGTSGGALLLTGAAVFAASATQRESTNGATSVLPATVRHGPVVSESTAITNTTATGHARAGGGHPRRLTPRSGLTDAKGDSLRARRIQRDAELQ